MAVKIEGIYYVPLKLICKVLGIDFSSQFVKIKEDAFFGPSSRVIKAKSEDGKRYKMFALPLQYLFGWLATINPKNVSPNARAAVMRCRKEFCDVLFKHFAKSTIKSVKSSEVELAYIEQITNLLNQEQKIRDLRKRMERELDEHRNDGITPFMDFL